VATTPAAGGNWKEFDWSALASTPNVKTALMHERNAIAKGICSQQEGCKDYGSYARQLIEGLERWQKQWDEVAAFILRVTLLAGRACMKPSNLLPKEAMA
jgi:hypothetical protein